MSEALTTQIADVERSEVEGPPRTGAGFFVFYAAVVAVQGLHVFEHVVQLIQVYVLGIPDERALGLLGYVFAFQGTEEWLHLVFNSVYLVCLVLITCGLVLSRGARSIVPGWAMAIFLVVGLVLEMWHVTEHVVIISNVIANNGCPCPGILDARLGVSDTVLHFGYNVVAYAGTIVPFAYLIQNRRKLSRMAPGLREVVSQALAQWRRRIQR